VSRRRLTALGDVAIAGGRGEVVACAQGDEQQVALAGFVPEHAFAVDPGGVACQDPERGFDLGAAVAAVDAQDQVLR